MLSLRHIALLLALLSGGLSCERAPAPQAAQPEHAQFSANEIALIARMTLRPDPPTDPTNALAHDPRAQQLGQRLFFEPRLSKNERISCASCHSPGHGFSTPQAMGHGIGVTTRHPPSLLNAGYQRWFNWDGSADSLWSQAIGPLEHPHEHGLGRVALAQRVAATPALRAPYEALFGTLPELSDEARFVPHARPVPSSPEDEAHVAWLAMRDEDRAAIDQIMVNVAKALGAYQLQLVQLGSPFDRFGRALVGAGPRQELEALSPQAQRGLKLFLGEARCVLCHTGAMLSDGDFHNLGLTPHAGMKPRDEGRGAGTPLVKRSPLNAAGRFSDDPHGERADWVRFLARTPEDRGQFKTPSLRNVALSPPYMHGGHLDTLADVVDFYNTLPGEAELGHREELLRPLNLTQEQRDDLVAFLEALTGEPLPEALTRAPQ